MKYGKKVVDIVDMYREVRDTYGTHKMNKYFIIEDKNSEVKIQNQNQCTKMYVRKEMDMVNTI